MKYVYGLIEVGDAAALLLVLALLLRGPFRKFWALLGYVVWVLLADAALTSFDIIYNRPSVSISLGLGASKEAMKWYSRLYWSNEVIVDLLQFLLVILLIYQATATGGKKVFTGRVLAGVVVVALALPFLVFPMGSKAWPQGTWFNSTSELLNFGAAIMNLGLWGALLSNRQRDPQLAVVSVGLGVLVTGAAISYGLRHFVPVEARFVPNLFLMLTQLLGWGIWCRAFWPAAARHLAPTKALQSP
jgi:hypothetical protein